MSFINHFTARPLHWQDIPNILWKWTVSSRNIFWTRRSGGEVTHLLRTQQSKAFLWQLRSCTVLWECCTGKSQPAKGLTPENICNNFLKCHIWKRTITMSTYSLRLTLSEVLFQQGPLMFCPIQGTVITLSAAVGDFFISSFSAHWRGSSAEVQLHCTAQWAQILSSPPCAARAQAAKAVPQVHYLSQSRVSSENSPPGRQLVALRTCIISPWKGGPVDTLLLLFPATSKFQKVILPANRSD